MVDGLEAITLPAFGPDLEPRDVDVRQSSQELETLFAVRETQLARQIRTTDADGCCIEVKREQISSCIRSSDEVVGAQQPMILLAVKQSREPPLDGDEPIRVSADRDPVRRVAKLAASMEG